ncbi:nucleoporin AMO1 [Rhypophila decipiens]
MASANLSPLDSCRFEHPRSGGGNRFSALNNQNNQMDNYGISVDMIQRDLVNEKPGWILSAYGPGKDAPEQLFGGYPREQSFEEIRWYFMEGLAKGNPNAALQEINQIYDQADKQMQTVLRDVNGAIKYVQEAAQKHPNRIDVCKQGTSTQPNTAPWSQQNQTSNAFGQPAQPSNAFGGTTTTTGAFGQPAALGQKPNPFGAPAFGQPSQPTTSAFGQPAQPASSAFGQPSAIGGSSAFGNPAFGQPAQPAASPFGQASALGVKPNAFGTPAFGQPTQPTSAFGQPSQPTSAFGQPSQPTSAFGQPSQPTSAFGQPSQPASAFGQPAALGQKPNPFGAPATGASPFGAVAGNNTQATTGVFGQPAQQEKPNPFGQPATAPTTSAFGQPSQPGTTSAFGQPATTTTTSPFGQPAAANPPAATNPFGQPTAAPPAANPFGKPAAPAENPFGQAAAPPAANPFGQAAQAQNAGFGTAQQQAQPNANPFGGPAAPVQQTQPQQSAANSGSQAQGPYGPSSTRQHPDPSTYIVKGMNGQVMRFNNQPVSYVTFKDKQCPAMRSSDGRNVTRIWFPDGPPNYSTETEAVPGPDGKDPYEDPKVKAEWDSFVQTGKFAGGMPEVPPKREFCHWVL